MSGPGGRLLVLDLQQHDQTWVRARFGDRRLGFSRSALESLLLGGGLVDVSVTIGAQKAGDPFTVLIASGAKSKSTSDSRLPKHATPQGEGPVVSGTDHLRDLLARRIVVLDGAMGTMLPDAVNKDAVVLTDPDRVRQIHAAYLEAGADIIKTNTFRATSVAQSPFGAGASVYEINLAAARLARDAADASVTRPPSRQRFVAGVIGPARAAPDVLREAYGQQVRGLIDGGADLLLVETIVNTRSVAAALEASATEFERRGSSVPLMLSATIDRQGRLPSGETLEAFVAAVADPLPFSIGLNCGHGARTIAMHVAELARHWDGCISCHPSAGLPDAFGEYGERPGDTARCFERSRRRDW